MAILFPNKDHRSAPYATYPSWVVSRIKANSTQRDNGCLEYGGGVLKHKYGMISLTLSGHNMRVTAPRAMWMATHKKFDLPRNIYVRHKCDNPCCVNIDHLEIGTPKDNAQDCVERGRRAKKYKPHSRILIHSDEKIISIRNASGKIKHVAARFGVSSGYVSKIRNGKAKALVA